MLLCLFAMEIDVGSFSAAFTKHQALGPQVGLMRWSIECRCVLLSALCSLILF